MQLGLVALTVALLIAAGAVMVMFGKRGRRRRDKTAEAATRAVERSLPEAPSDDAEPADLRPPPRQEAEPPRRMNGRADYN